MIIILIKELFTEYKKKYPKYYTQDLTKKFTAKKNAKIVPIFWKNGFVKITKAKKNTKIRFLS